MRQSWRDKYDSARALYAYFRGAEYPLGRLAAWKAALDMAFIQGWPR